jgi:hypothetical protein
MKPTSSEAARVYKAVPQLARIREQVLLGDVWKQPYDGHWADRATAGL